MMFERFTQDARAVVGTAETEARAAGATSIDAEHLLLALTDRGGSAGRARTASALAGAGLDHATLVTLLADEEAASLEAVGVDAGDWAGVPVRPRRGRLRFGASAKLALERTLRAAVSREDRRIGAEHVLLGVLAADTGRVPRALAQAGVDRAALRDAV